MLEQIRANNVERFAGYGALYDRNRPEAPQEVVDILCAYLGRKPSTVVDAGCGTGLSTFLWLGVAERIIGVEPNDDMRQVALAKWEALQQPPALRFVKGWAHQLELASESVDLVTCSQSFHWMEPASTLREFGRVLRPGGIFAAYDCDWPPAAIGSDLEQHYHRLVEMAEALAQELSPKEKQAHKWDKNGHLEQIRRSGVFRFSREIVFHHWEPCDAERYVNLALSQGGLQTALKRGAGEPLRKAIEAFRDQAVRAFGGGTRQILFGYRMRLGMK